MHGLSSGPAKPDAARSEWASPVLAEALVVFLGRRLFWMDGSGKSPAPGLGDQVEGRAEAAELRKGRSTPKLGAC